MPLESLTLPLPLGTMEGLAPLEVPTALDPFALMVLLGWLPLEVIEVPAPLKVLKAGDG